MCTHPPPHVLILGAEPLKRLPQGAAEAHWVVLAWQVHLQRLLVHALHIHACTRMHAVCHLKPHALQCDWQEGVCVDASSWRPHRQAPAQALQLQSSMHQAAARQPTVLAVQTIQR